MLPVSFCSRHHQCVSDWARLGARVVNRRVQFKLLTREMLATRSGISTRVLGDIEKGRRDNYDPMTLAALEQALRWETGSVRRILDGGEPTDLATPTARSGTTSLAQVAMRKIGALRKMSGDGDDDLVLATIW